MEMPSQDRMSNYIYMHLYLYTTCIHSCACSARLFIPGDRRALWQHLAAVLLLTDRRRFCARNAVLPLALSSTWYNAGVRIVSSWFLVSHRIEVMQTSLSAASGLGRGARPRRVSGQKQRTIISVAPALHF